MFVVAVDKMFVVKVYFHHKHFIDPTNCAWVSEDGFFKIEQCLLWDIEGQKVKFGELVAKARYFLS